MIKKTIILIQIFFLVSFTHMAKAESQDSFTATISIKINTDYRNIDNNQYLLEDIMELAPWTRVRIVEGDTISDITTRYYGFGLTEAKQTYSFVEKEILFANKLDKPESLKPGFISIPTLPKIATRSWNPKNDLNQIPKIFDLKTAQIVKLKSAPGISNYMLSSIPELEFKGRKGARNTILKVEYNEKMIKKLNEIKDFWSNDDIQVEDQTIQINFGTFPSKCNSINSELHNTLNAKEVTMINEILQMPPKRKVIIIILDSGWPDQESYENSQNEIFKIFEIARSYLHLNSKKINLNSSFKEPINTHCVDIANSLREFIKLDNQNRIRIIYFPLTRDQNSMPIFEELLFLHLILKKTHPNTGIDKPNKMMIRSARKEAKEKMKRIQNSKKGLKINSDKIILDALFSLLEIFQKKEDTTYFLNLSWTVVNRLLKPQFPDFPLGIVVTAAGNIEGKNIYEEPYIDLAARSKNHLDTITILNVARNKANTQCHSSIVLLNSINYNSTNALAFDGRVSQGLCGTSFSTPRVAWLLALSESYRSDDIKKEDWLAYHQNKILKIRKKIVSIDSHDYSDLSYLWLDPIKLLKDIKNKEIQND